MTNVNFRRVTGYCGQLARGIKPRLKEFGRLLTEISPAPDLNARLFSAPRESASPAAAPSTKRRLASQHVREARDRLTSTSGTRPVFD